MFPVIIVVTFEVSQFLRQWRVLLVVLLLVLPIFGRELIMLFKREIETVNWKFGREQQMSVLISRKQERDNNFGLEPSLTLISYRETGFPSLLPLMVQRAFH